MTNLIEQEALQEHKLLKTYYVGDNDNRPWGSYEVLNVGWHDSEEFCEKRIGVKPRQALSLQRHQLRREIWQVEQGQLTVILDGDLHTLNAGETIMIPLKAVHCMINLTDEEVVVFEKQIGICREEDNDRLCDLSGRDTVYIDPSDTNALESKKIYEKVMEQIA